MSPSKSPENFGQRPSQSQVLAHETYMNSVHKQNSSPRGYRPLHLRNSRSKGSKESKESLEKRKKSNKSRKNI